MKPRSRSKESHRPTLTRRELLRSAAGLTLVSALLGTRRRPRAAPETREDRPPSERPLWIGHF